MLVEISPKQRAAQGTCSGSPEALREFRRAWHCDCDGESHELVGYERTQLAGVVRQFSAYIGELTGHEPMSCPWRAYYDPLVKAVIKIRQLSDDGLADAELGADPAGILLDAYALYKRAYAVTHAEELDFERKQRESRRGR